MTYYLVVFAAGFAGSFHCLGMCGGFACALGRDPRGRQATVLRHLLYNIGRASTYTFLGALAGALGYSALQSAGTPLDSGLLSGQRLLAIAAGLLMVLMSLQFFGLLRSARGGVLGFGGDSFVASLRSLVRAPGPAAPLALGVVNGFLPCPLVYAFLAQSASTGHPLFGVSTMAAFALGTFPAMLFMGGLGQLLKPAWRHRGVRIAGVFILILGLLTLLRGVLALAGDKLLLFC